jgi:hypothetical protein
VNLGNIWDLCYLIDIVLDTLFWRIRVLCLFDLNKYERWSFGTLDPCGFSSHNIPCTRCETVRFHIVMAAGMNMTVFWDVALCCVVDVYWCFGDAYCLHHQCDLMMEAACTFEVSVSFYQTAQCHVPDDGHLQDAWNLHFSIYVGTWTKTRNEASRSKHQI